MIAREEIGRHLTTLSDSGRRAMAMLYGARGVGKTYLLAGLWEPDRAFHFTASRTSPEINRRVLLEELASWSGGDVGSVEGTGWTPVFESLFRVRPGEDLVVVLDEFENLAGEGAGLRRVAEELVEVWEGAIERRGGLLLVLAGSAVTSMRGLLDERGPLHGRVGWERELGPLDYYDTGRAAPEYGAADRVRLYGAFGGRPGYLRHLDPERPLGDNIVDLLLEPHGAVRLQLEAIPGAAEGLREHATYRGILQAVGTGRRQRAEIAAALGRPQADTPLRRMLAQLVELGLLEEGRGFGEPTNQPIHYRIPDPALRFHYGIVLPNESAIDTAGAGAVWAARVADHLFPEYVAADVFPDVVHQAYLRQAAAGELPAVREWGRWDGVDREGNPLKLDVVARLEDGRMLTGGVEFRRHRPDAATLDAHLDTLRRLADLGRDWAREALEPESTLFFVSLTGFHDSLVQAASVLRHPLVTGRVEDLY